LGTTCRHRTTDFALTLISMRSAVRAFLFGTREEMETEPAGHWRELAAGRLTATGV
jgi:hypothetical protein